MLASVAALLRLSLEMVGTDVSRPPHERSNVRVPYLADVPLRHSV